MDTNTLNDYLLKLVQESSKELLKIYFNKPDDRKTLLRIPEYRSGEKRISEQELRFTLTNLHGQFQHPELYFSVETPTENNYVFDENAKGNRSASSDLSFYHKEDKVMNIEFKAHNPEQPSIDKDIEKLTKENFNGAWVHLIDGEDKGTIKRLFEKFKKAFEGFPTSEKPISFHILILKTKTLLSRKGKENETDYSKNIFNIDYELWKELEKGQYQFKDWQIDVFDI
ncbi:hypothetical protein [Patiriisocius sp. Uisw_017]|uniref:hypothetical protein n=1 Tax=Patiriisocius sp. Uisw_017 TaxID=3230968 RepID=UPI0039E9B463